ncbi:unnamed protein product [Cochlearia groenlandica]
MQSQSETAEDIDKILRQGDDNNNSGSDSNNEVGSFPPKSTEQTLMVWKEQNRREEPVQTTLVELVFEEPKSEAREDASIPASTRRKRKELVVDVSSASSSLSSEFEIHNEK